MPSLLADLSPEIQRRFIDRYTGVWTGADFVAWGAVIAPGGDRLLLVSKAYRPPEP